MHTTRCRNNNPDPSTPLIQHSAFRQTTTIILVSGGYIVYRPEIRLQPSDSAHSANDILAEDPRIRRLKTSTLAGFEEEIDSKKYSEMFQACRIAARRATRRSSCQAMEMLGANSTSDTSFGFVSIFLLSAAVTAAKRDSAVEETSTITECEGNAECEHASSSAYYQTNDIRLKRAMTSRRMDAEKTRRTFFSLYEVDFDVPLGSGAYGDVYLCRRRLNGEAYALKKIPKEFTEDSEFQREMNALLHIRGHGGHPNICMLRENFEADDDYLLVLDLINGGEMFDHLIEHGAYSEADASRLLRQVASAMTFCHGIGVIHADLKPENIMLRNYMLQNTRGDSVIKLIDFGCSEVLSHPEEEYLGPSPPRKLKHEEAATTAYCPPEAFDDDPVELHPSVDMWALGIITYMMLVGRHPFDLDCDASDEEIGRRIRAQRQTPLDDCPYASALSTSALDLLRRLLEPDPKKRMTAYEMLHHPWVTGETATEDVMEDSAKRLKRLHKYKSGIEKTVIESLLAFSDMEPSSDEESNNNENQSMPLLERAFDHIDKDKKGFLTRDDLRSLPTGRLVRRNTKTDEVAELNKIKMSFNNFSDLIGQNMQSIHFEKGKVIYSEGDDGDYMYFINSGTVEVSTKDGFRTKKVQGDFFGKGGITGRKRRTTITTSTPVNVLRIDKKFFAKYIVKDSPIALKLREKANKERFDRAMDIMSRLGDMEESTYKRGDVIFNEGEEPKDAYIVKEGLVNIDSVEHHIYSVKPNRIFGIQSQILKRDRKASAICASDECVINRMPISRLQKLALEFPVLHSALHEIALRQEFRRAVVLRRKKSFPNREQLREAFDELDVDQSGALDESEIKSLMTSLGAAFSDQEIAALVKTMDLNDSGEVNFGEFESVFG